MNADAAAVVAASDIEVDARPQVAGGRYLMREAFLMPSE
jgi:hypothetical protein